MATHTRTQRKTVRTSRTPRRWSQHVTDTSDAMTLEPAVFKAKSPRAIARSIMRSAERSHRRKSPPFRSAMSMLTFYVNRAGKNLPAARKRVLMQAKDELRRLYHRAPAPPQARARSSRSRPARS